MAIRDDMEDVQEAVINELITENGITNTLADGQVTETKIANGAVTAAKLDRAYLESTGGAVSGNVNVSGTVIADGLTVDGATTVNGSNINIDNGYGYTWGSNAVQIYSNGSYLRARTNNTDRLAIDSSGRVLINTTASSDPAVNNVDNAIRLASDTGRVSASAVGTTALILNRKSSDGDIAEFRRAGSAKGSISVNSSGTSYNTSSDHRLKENVVELTGATERLKQLEPKRFNFIADADTTVDGFLAHEVSSIVPEAVTGTKDAVDEDGNPEYQGIDQSKLVPLLTKALQEAVSKIEALEARVEQLENI